METLPPSEYRILSELVRSSPVTGRSVQSLSKELDVSPAFVSQRMKKLHAAGWVDRDVIRTPRGRTVRYRPKPGIAVQWISPDRRVVHSWRSIGEVDWQYPLTSQIADLAARSSVLAFLRQLDRRKLLPETGKKGVSGSLRQASIVLFGSSARGTARPTSDVDLLVLLSPWKRSLERTVLDLAAGVSVTHDRPIQAFVAEHDIPFSIPPEIVRAIQSEGIVVFDGSHPSRVAGMRTVWDLVYMGRIP